MANTKDTLLIVQSTGALDETKNQAGRTLTAGELTTYGLTLAAATNAAGFATLNVADSAGATTTNETTESGYDDNLYAAATPQVHTIDTTGVTAGEELFITVIDVTNGRQRFPRKTFAATTAAALAAFINGAEIEVGDGNALTAVDGSGTITLTSAADVILRVAANEDSVVVETVAPALSTGLKAADVADFVGSKVTKAGRTNRVGFPIVEPSIFTDLGIQVSTNYDVLTTQIVSDVKFDKNTGASYQDVEHVTVLIADGATTANT
jgi:hypothetical protein